MILLQAIYGALILEKEGQILSPASELIWAKLLSVERRHRSIRKRDV